MDEITHHLPDRLLMAYAAGALPEAFELVVAAHVSMCDECRARLGAFDAVGGTLLEETSGAALDEDSLDRTLRLIAEAEAEGEAKREAPAARSGDLPQPLHAYIGGSLADVRWRRLGGGVFDAVLPVEGDATARLLRIKPGTRVPDHGHKGEELTLVLKGAFSDASGRFGPGDVECAGDDMEHTPVAEPGEDCICLAAMDNPLKFKKVLPRLAQRVMRL